jgi:hypothetical protein
MKGYVDTKSSLLYYLDLPFMIRASGILISDKEIKEL